MYTRRCLYRISTTNRYLLPPMLNTVRASPRKLAEANAFFTSCALVYFATFIALYHTASGLTASAWRLPNSANLLREMIRTNQFPADRLWVTHMVTWSRCDHQGRMLPPW